MIKRFASWSDAENAYAREWLNRLPNVKAIRERLTQVMTARIVSYGQLAHRKGRLFAIKREPPRAAAFSDRPPLGRFARPGAGARRSEPDRSQGNDGHRLVRPLTGWRIWSPSRCRAAEARRATCTCSKPPRDRPCTRSFPMSTGGRQGEIWPGCRTAAGSSTRDTPNRASARPPISISSSKSISTSSAPRSAADRYELGKDFPRVAEIEFEMDNASGTLLATVQNGDGGQF